MDQYNKLKVSIFNQFNSINYNAQNLVNNLICCCCSFRHRTAKKKGTKLTLEWGRHLFYVRMWVELLIFWSSNCRCVFSWVFSFSFVCLTSDVRFEKRLAQLTIVHHWWISNYWFLTSCFVFSITVNWHILYIFVNIPSCLNCCSEAFQESLLISWCVICRTIYWCCFFFFSVSEVHCHEGHSYMTVIQSLNYEVSSLFFAIGFNKFVFPRWIWGGLKFQLSAANHMKTASQLQLSR